MNRPALNVAVGGLVRTLGKNARDNERLSAVRVVRPVCRLHVGIAFGLALCAGLWSIAAPAMTDAQKSACVTVLTLRGWHPPLTLAGDVSDAEAVSLLRRHLRWQQTVVTATHLTPQTRQVKNALWGAVRDFDLGALYKRLPEERGDWRSVTLGGELASGQYRVTEQSPDAFNQPLTPLGATASQLAMRPRAARDDGPRGDRYELRARLRANMGAMAWADVLQAGWMSLHHLSTTAPLPTPSGGGFVGGTGSDAEILLQLEPAFPHFFRWYLGISEIPNVLARDKARSRARHLHLTVQLNDGLREHYPKVADYIEQLKDIVNADVTIRNDAGRWLRAELDSVHERLTLDAWVLDGHLVPSRDGTPRPDAIDPDTPLDRLSFRSVVNARLKALGVTVKLSDWPIAWQYQRTDNGADYVGRITQQPGIDVSGAALGFIPTGVIDVAIPGNIEGIVRDFMQVLTRSNDGEGALLNVNFAEDPGRGSILSIGADGDTLDNFFVHFAVSLVSKRIIPNGDQFEGLKRLASDGLTAIIKDTDGLVTAQNTAQDVGLSSLVKQCRVTE